MNSDHLPTWKINTSGIEILIDFILKTPLKHDSTLLSAYKVEASMVTEHNHTQNDYYYTLTHVLSVNCLVGMEHAV